MVFLHSFWSFKKGHSFAAREIVFHWSPLPALAWFMSYCKYHLKMKNNIMPLKCYWKTENNITSVNADMKPNFSVNKSIATDQKLPFCCCHQRHISEQHLSLWLLTYRVILEEILSWFWKKLRFITDLIQAHCCGDVFVNKISTERI